MKIKEKRTSEFSVDISKYADELKKHIDKKCKKETSASREGLCVKVSRWVKDFLDARGVDSVILEGDVVLAPHHSLEHRINLANFGDSVWVIDFTSSQIPALKGKEPIFERLPNNRKAVEKFLHETYNWWIPPNKESE